MLGNSQKKKPKQTNQTQKLERRQAQNRKVFLTELVRPVEPLLKAVAETSSLYESKRKLENVRRLRKTPELLQMLKSSRGFREKHCVFGPFLPQAVLRTPQGIRWVLGVNQFSHSYVVNLTLEN